MLQSSELPVCLIWTVFDSQSLSRMSAGALVNMGFALKTPKKVKMYSSDIFTIFFLKKKDLERFIFLSHTLKMTFSHKSDFYLQILFKYFQCKIRKGIWNCLDILKEPNSGKRSADFSKKMLVLVNFCYYTSKLFHIITYFPPFLMIRNFLLRNNSYLNI